FAKGVGEFPLTEQATCSLWESAAHIDAFAYKSNEHSPMIKKTRQFNWYREEMFVRMKVLRTL
ncbi:MAG: Spheroidene monooxygenase, partial [Bacteroidota bacterium]